MNLTHLTKGAEKILRDNAPTILTALGVSGTLSTAYLAHQAGFKAALIIDQNESKGGTAGALKQRLKERARLVWKLYIPTGISGVLTIGSIIGATKVGMRRTAAAYSLLTISEQAFAEYKAKVVEQLGVKKEQTVRDEIAQDRVNQNPSGAVVVISPGNVLCYEMHTGRYFSSDMETLRKAVNEINAKMIRETEASLSDFYYMIGLPQTSYSCRTGWSVCKMLELNFSSVMSEDNRPCLAFEYNYIEPF